MVIAEESPTPAERQILLQARLLWGSFLTGVAIFSGVVVYLQRSGKFAGTGEPLDLFPVIAWGGAVLSVPTAFVMRAVMARRAAGPTGWLQSNIIAYAMLEGAMLLSVVFALISGSLTPYAYSAAVPLFFYLVLFPASSPRREEP